MECFNNIRSGVLYTERDTQKKNKAWHTTKVSCECGGQYTLSHKEQHFKTKHHQNYLNSNTYNDEIP